MAPRAACLFDGDKAKSFGLLVKWVSLLRDFQYASVVGNYSKHVFYAGYLHAIPPVITWPPQPADREYIFGVGLQQPSLKTLGHYWA